MGESQKDLTIFFFVSAHMQEEKDRKLYIKSVCWVLQKSLQGQIKNTL